MNAAAGHLPRSIAWRRSWICVSSSGKPLNAPFHYPSPAPLRICWTRSIPLKNGSAVHEYKDATAIAPQFPGAQRRIHVWRRVLAWATNWESFGTDPAGSGGLNLTPHLRSSRQTTWPNPSSPSTLTSTSAPCGGKSRPEMQAPSAETSIR